MTGNFLIVSSCAAPFFAWDASYSFRPGSAPENEAVQTLSSGPSKSGRKRRALVVDDVADVTDMLSVLLTHAGFDVITANSAVAALTVARAHQFDVIISDIGMPEMNGFEMAKTLRSFPGYEATPMVAVTGYAMFNDLEESLRSGFTAHMTKPIDPHALLNLIDQL